MTPPPPTSTLFPYTTLFRSILSINFTFFQFSERQEIIKDKSQMIYRGLDTLNVFIGLFNLALHHVLFDRSEEHTSELQSHSDIVCRLLLEKKNKHPIKV